MDVPLLDALRGQVVLVTGASRGIGHEVARQLQGLGATVYAGVRRPDAEVPRGTEPIQLDITRRDDITDAIERIENEAGRLDVLVNNAAVLEQPFRRGLLEETPDEIEAVLRTNLLGTILVTRAALPLLFARRGGRVVNLSSGYGALGEGMSGRVPAYRISKTGVNGLTVYLHGEYHEEHGLIANSVCPGWVKTKMGGSQATRPVEKGAETPVWLARFAPLAPSGLWFRDREPIEW